MQLRGRRFDSICRHRVKPYFLYQAPSFDSSDWTFKTEVSCRGGRLDEKGVVAVIAEQLGLHNHLVFVTIWLEEGIIYQKGPKQQILLYHNLRQFRLKDGEKNSVRKISESKQHPMSEASTCSLWFIGKPQMLHKTMTFNRQNVRSSFKIYRHAHIILNMFFLERFLFETITCDIWGIKLLHIGNRIDKAKKKIEVYSIYIETSSNQLPISDQCSKINT